MTSWKITIWLDSAGDTDHADVSALIEAAQLPAGIQYQIEQVTES